MNEEPLFLRLGHVRRRVLLYFRIVDEGVCIVVQLYDLALSLVGQPCTGRRNGSGRERRRLASRHKWTRQTHSSFLDGLSIPSPSLVYFPRYFCQCLSVIPFWQERQPARSRSCGSIPHG